MCLLCCCVDNEVFVIKKVPTTASDDGDEEAEDNERTLGRNEVDSDATDIDEDLRLSESREADEVNEMAVHEEVVPLPQRCKGKA
jgi:hypothetical protein